MNDLETAQNETAIFGAGCFWCVEAVFDSLDGVVKVESGYTGGHVENPTYEDICTGQSGHAEVAKVTFDPKTISFDELLDWFWRSHNPTTLNQQGADRGTQYRSVIFYSTPAQKDAAEASKAKAQKLFSDPIVTEITEAPAYYPAEAYHQNYYQLNKSAFYCQMVISPKLQKLELE